MKRVLHAFVALALFCCARAASHATEAFAWRWLREHRQAPGGADMQELKSVNPEAFAIVQALLMKQSMGLIKRKHGSGGMPVPDMPDMIPGMPVAPAVVAEGAPTDVMGSGQPAPEELPELAPQTPTAPPAMPPPPPISPPLPPALEEPEAMPDSNPIPAPAPAPLASMEPAPVAPEPFLPVRLSAAATSSSVSTGSRGGGFGLNWNPDKMIADNERMVSNVLGAVAQLTVAHVHRAKKEHEDASDSPLAKDDLLADASPLHRALARQSEEPVREREEPVPETLPMRTVARPSPPMRQAEEPVQSEPKVMSAADEYLASTASMPAERRQPAEPSDDGIAGHLPGDVSWSNPYTFTASATAALPSQRQENSYLREVDLGMPTVRLPPKHTSDDQNPYLQGLDLTGSGPVSAPVAVSASALTAMRQSQLLSSHSILYEHDLEFSNDGGRKQTHSAKAVKAKKDALSGFLAPSQGARAKAPPASLVNKNAYLAKLGDSSATQASYSASSALASNIESDNPYLQALDDSPVQMEAPEAVQAPVAAASASMRDPWAKTQPSRPQLSMTSSTVAKSKAVTQKAKTTKKKNGQSLSGWLGAGSSAKAPDFKAQRLQQVVAQKVADNKNPYLKGLDIDSGVQKVAPAEAEVNPYMASFD